MIDYQEIRLQDIAGLHCLDPWEPWAGVMEVMVLLWKKQGSEYESLKGPD